ncbi:MAG: type II toxin-antitoxin system VapC family toxin [Anaerolineae bacterium]|nr:type II toxin-antitoxin system VapC family toxin [Anaerolineae bacterium]
MAAVVIDANLAIGLVRQMPFSAAFRTLIERWLVEGVSIAVPALWDYEIVSGLRRLWQQNAITREEAFAGLELVMSLEIQRSPAEQDLLLSSLRWAERLGQSKAYDAQYVALAEQLHAEFWSADEKLVNALKALEVDWAHWIGEVQS